MPSMQCLARDGRFITTELHVSVPVDVAFVVTAFQSGSSDGLIACLTAPHMLSHTLKPMFLPYMPQNQHGSQSLRYCEQLVNMFSLDLMHSSG